MVTAPEKNVWERAVFRTRPAGKPQEKCQLPSAIRVKP